MGRIRPGSTAPGEDDRADGIEQYGWGERDPVTGLFEGYDIPDTKWSQIRGRAAGWREILPHLGVIDVDMHAVYGIDVEDDALMSARSGSWLRARVLGVVADTRTRSHRLIFPPKR